MKHFGSFRWSQLNSPGSKVLNLKWYNDLAQFDFELNISIEPKFICPSDQIKVQLEMIQQNCFA